MLPHEDELQEYPCCSAMGLVKATVLAVAGDAPTAMKAVATTALAAVVASAVVIVEVPRRQAFTQRETRRADVITVDLL
jgi:hypothetical protein